MDFKDLSIGQLKKIAADRGIEPTGDKRKHSTWLEALNSPGPIELAIEAVESSPGAIELLETLSESDSWNPADFGEVSHLTDPSGQLQLFEFDVDEPPDPDDYPDMFAFWAAYDAWCDRTDGGDRPSQPANPPSAIEPIEVPLESFCFWASCEFLETALSPAIGPIEFARRSLAAIESIPESVVEEVSALRDRCPCGAVGYPDSCDGETVTLRLRDRVATVPCFGRDLSRCCVAARSPPGAGGDAF